MFGYLDFLFLGFSGRIGRAAYWLSSIALNIIECVALYGVLALAHDSIVGLEPHSAQAVQKVLTHVIIPSCLVIGIFIYPQFAVMTKRCHDRGRSGWFWLVSFIPVIGGLWLLIELGFLPGDEGTNEYGYP